MNYLAPTVPERIIENEAEETKSDKNKNDKSMYSLPHLASRPSWRS